jgi:Tfp pilus assembly protein PilV
MIKAIVLAVSLIGVVGCVASTPESRQFARQQNLTAQQRLHEARMATINNRPTSCYANHLGRGDYAVNCF